MDAALGKSLFVIYPKPRDSMQIPKKRDRVLNQKANLTVSSLRPSMLFFSEDAMIHQKDFTFL